MGQIGDQVQQRLDSRPQYRRRERKNTPRKRRRGCRREFGAERLRETPDLLNDHRAHPHEKIAGADDRQIGLRLLPSVVNCPEQLGHARFEAGQDLGVAAVGLARILGDQLDAPWVHHVDLEPVVAKMA